MENIVKSLKIRCAEAGVSLTQVCQSAKVNRSVLTRWEQKPPKTLQTLDKIEKALADVEHQRGNAPKN